MIYYYECFSKIIKLTLESNKLEELDFWLYRFCPSVNKIDSVDKYDISIECFESSFYDYLVDGNKIKLYGNMKNYSSFLAKFITQVFQKLLIYENILFVPAACVGNNKDCLLILGDFWQGKTSTALSIANKHNLHLLSDNYIAIKDGIVIGATKYISKRKEDSNNSDESLLIVNQRCFFENPYNLKFNDLKIKNFLIPFINSSNKEVHFISLEESKWYLYQKFIRLLSGETILFDGKLPSPIFLDKEASIIILNIVNKLLQENKILYVSSDMDTIVSEGFKIL